MPTATRPSLDDLYTQSQQQARPSLDDLYSQSVAPTVPQNQPVTQQQPTFLGNLGNSIKQIGGKLLSGAGNIISGIEQPFVSLASTPFQAGIAAVNKVAGTNIPDPYAQGVPGLFGSTVSASPLNVEAKAGDVLKAASEIGGVVAAPETIGGAAITGAGLGAAQTAGGAMQQGASAPEVLKQGAIGGAVGGLVGGAVAGIGKIIGAVGDKIMTSVIKPTKPDIADGFSLDTIKQYDLGGTLHQTLEKTQNLMNSLTDQLQQKLSASDSTIDLNDIVNQTASQLTSQSKLKAFGANAGIANALDKLKNEVSIVSEDSPLSIPEAQIVKQAAGNFGAWQYGQTDPDARASEIVYNTFYNKLKTAIEDNSPDGVKEINQQLSKLIPVANAVIRRLPVAERNSAISLPEMIGLVGSTFHPAALGPTMLAMMTRSGVAGSLLSKLGPEATRLAAPAAVASGALVGTALKGAPAQTQ